MTKCAREDLYILEVIPEPKLSIAAITGIRTSCSMASPVEVSAAPFNMDDDIFNDNPAEAAAGLSCPLTGNAALTDILAHY